MTHDINGNISIYFITINSMKSVLILNNLPFANTYQNIFNKYKTSNIYFSNKYHDKTKTNVYFKLWVYNTFSEWKKIYENIIMTENIIITENLPEICVKKQVQEQVQEQVQIDPQDEYYSNIGNISSFFLEQHKNYSLKNNMSGINCCFSSYGVPPNNFRNNSFTIIVGIFVMLFIFNF